MIKTLFLGSGEFPLPILEKLKLSDKIKLVGYITNRTDEFTSNPPSNLQIFKPRKLSDEQKKTLSTTEPDLIVVCNYGQFLDKNILNYPKYGCLNIHASLLPILRGACPIEMAIIQNHTETGISVQLMTEKMDEGDIIFQKELLITNKETGGSLRNKLQKLTSENIENILIDWVNNKLKPRKQNPKNATYCYKNDISKERARVDWKEAADLIERKVRAFNPKPVSWTFLGSKRFKIFKASTEDRDLNAKPGYTISKNNILLIQTGQGVLIPQEVQLEGKKRMNIDVFLTGYKGKFNFK